MKQSICLLFLLLLMRPAQSQPDSAFRVVGFYTAKNDLAHISFVHEANQWLSAITKEQQFRYDSTNNWSNLNDSFLSRYQVVMFLDTRPEDSAQRKAFERYMNRGGGWIGFHFAAFALPGSAYPDNWYWYHHQFLGAGAYKGNTWRPTAAILRIEDSLHPITSHLPITFRSAPNEWYSWEKDLRKNPSIHILLSIDPQSFPLGTGPKAYEIWHEGDYPVAWTNTNYRMVYFNMGHNDMDYGRTNSTLSFQFDNPEYRQLLLNALNWLGRQH